MATTAFASPPSALGAAATASAPHFPARAKRVIHLFMNGGPSQVDTFDPKPLLNKYHGQRPPNANLKTERRTGGLFKSPFAFNRHGKSGIEVSEIAPGMVDTDIRNDSDHPAVIAAVNARKFEPLTPEEVAEAVAFALLSSDNCANDLIELRPRGAAA